MKVKDLMRDKVNKAVRSVPGSRTDNQNEHYYTDDPSSEMITSVIEFVNDGLTYKITSSSGVFGKRRIDKGTELLINTVPNLNNLKVLDLGSGTGVVSVVIARKYPDATVFASDVNKRAVLLTKNNARKNNVKIKVFHSDGFEKINEKFDYILLNPPQSAGKDVCLRLIRESFDYLNENGILLMVARKNKGGRSLSDYMEEVFGNVNSIGIKTGYHVYKSNKFKG